MAHPINPQSKKRGCGKGCLILVVIGFAITILPVFFGALSAMKGESVNTVEQSKAQELRWGAATRARQEKIAGLVAEIKAAEGDDRKAKLEKLLAFDPNTKEFSEELVAPREKIKQREQEARAKWEAQRQAEVAREEQSRIAMEVARKTQSQSVYLSKADASVVPRAKRAVARELKDPDSAQFKDVGYAFSEKTGNVAYGWVNSKNGLGGYTGFQRFVANETTVLLEEREEIRTLAAWREAAAGRMTEQSLAKLSQVKTSVVPVVFDVKTVVAKTPAEVSKLLGKPNGTEKSKYGITYKYQSPDIEILFTSGKANIITVNGLGSVSFSPAAIQSLGLPLSNPSFANKEILIRWESVTVDKLPMIKEVQINRGQTNCEFATVAVKGLVNEE